MTYAILELLALLGGFYLLSRGSDALVEGGEGVAHHFRVSSLTIGLTVVAWGTSLPELVISSWSAAHGKAGESLGTVVGSNVVNMGLVLGVCAVILPATIERRVRLRDGFWLLASLALVYAVLRDGTVSRTDGALLVGTFLYYEWGLLKAGKREGLDNPDLEIDTSPLGPHYLKIALGSVAIGIGARTAMWGGEGLALRAGMTPTVVGLTVFAVGTSLPELFAGVSSARRGQAAMGLGNVLGSNVFNVLAALGCAAVVRPIGNAPTEVQEVLQRDIPTAFGFSLMLLALPFLPTKWGRVKGWCVLVAYLVYVAFLFRDGLNF
ncbi:MAG: sodium:calcium antiporter [Planctomycetes bacterium]|nr:sodium:calcium antiporter [Planctomycetota bacterium]MCB9909905.1 sodium:calcium antiporter [Planctomycetota bacterium]MCB9912958.1 sodium:calcium antiporter [Planctomycetota bacterium]HPF14440.1 sodium:calcium antiporter [Planctomycetota bacterium]HRV82540.1 sodium:calcium antiporter [Planctomycetota bacterium]